MFDHKLNHNIAILICVLLLCTSCCLMITAWYFHLKFENWPFWMATLISWFIALPEYVCMIPANRIGFGSGALSVAGLKGIAEVIQVLAFIIFHTVVLRQQLVVNHLVGFAVVIAGFIIVLVGPFHQTVIHGLPPLPHLRPVQAPGAMELKNEI